MESCYKIFKYWRNKAITKQGDVVDSSDVKGRLVVENAYLPSCFACGRAVQPKDIMSWDKYDLTVEEIWKNKKVNSKLQRCHIVAKQFGGADTADNLFLMCSDCHFESPDTQNRAAFFRWVYRRKEECSHGIDWHRFLEEFTREIEMREYNIEEFAKKFNALPRKEKDNCLNAAWEKCGLHCTSISTSTVMVAMIDSIESKIKEKEKVLTRGGLL